MIVLYKGARGCGKSLSMVKDGYKFLTRGFRILRNFDATFGEYIDNEKILNLDKNANLFNCVLMIDEMQIFLDSRRSMSNQNIFFSNFIQQIRKRNIIMLCATQFSNTLDLRLKQHVDIIAYPNFHKKYNVCEVTYLDLTMRELSFGQEIRPTYVRIVFNAVPVFSMYNTSEMIR